MRHEYHDDNGDLKDPRIIELENIFAVMEGKGLLDRLPSGMSDLERIGFEIRNDGIEEIAQEVGLILKEPKAYAAMTWDKPGQGYVIIRGLGEIELVQPKGKHVDNLETDYTHDFRDGSLLLDATRVLVTGGPVVKYDLISED